MAIKTSQLERGRLNLSKPLEQVFEEYFASLAGETPKNLYKTMLGELELLLLNRVMFHEQGNQSQTAKTLGLSKSSVRNKIAFYKIDCLEIRRRSQPKAKIEFL